jgi:cell division protein FtsZ
VLRTGTHDGPSGAVPVLNQVAHVAAQGPGSSLGSSTPDYSPLSTPSVWRSPRSQAAAKVEALSSNGMDEIEIPAFLRKQAD